MIVLLDTGDIPKAAQETGCECGQLLTPLTRRADFGFKYGIDNGAFARFNQQGFLSLLVRQETARDRCLFVAAPDVVGNARRTLEAFEIWCEKLSSWPVALVAQDGQEELEIPWKRISAIFIGGTDAFKTSRAAKDICLCAKLLEKWVHVGRVNTPVRFDAFVDIVDSVDGTGISRYTHMRRKLLEDPIPLLRGEIFGG